MSTQPSLRLTEAPPATTPASGESFSRTEDEANELERLRDIHLDLVPRLGANWNQHSLVTLRRQSLSRVLYYDWIYQKLVGKPGVICEFGVQWGSGLATLLNLRAIHEPYNHQRKLVGFDTFEGFPEVSREDGGAHASGEYATDQGHEEVLLDLLKLHEAQSPLAHIPKVELRKGDASETVHKWLADNPGTAIGLAIFDMDLYAPTRAVLEAIRPRLFCGSILAFDEFSCANWPGETRAVDEVLGLSNLRFEHFPHQPGCAICVLD